MAVLEPLRKTAGPSRSFSNRAELLSFVQKLCTASSLAELDAAFLAGFGRLLDAPRYALYVLESPTGRPEHVASANISDTFLARYERMPEGRQTDPLLAHVLATGRVAYNLALMSLEEWLESPFYRRVSQLHGCRQLVMAPIANGSGLVGTVNFGTDTTTRAYAEDELQLAEALGRLLGVVIERIRSQGRLQHEHRQALAALDVAGTAVVISHPQAVEPQFNAAARRLVEEVANGEEQLYRLIARPGGSDSFSRRTEVELVVGGSGILHAHSSPAPDNGDALITVLELQRDRPELAAGILAALTPREREVAALVADGLTDREIATSLCLSPHTVSQYVKRVYRKLDVGSRVALTRVLLDLPAATPG